MDGMRKALKRSKGRALSALAEALGVRRVLGENDRSLRARTYASLTGRATPPIRYKLWARIVNRFFKAMTDEDFER